MWCDDDVMMMMIAIMIGDMILMIGDIYGNALAFSRYMDPNNITLYGLFVCYVD